MNTTAKNLISFLIKAAKIIFIGPMALAFTMAGAYYLFKTFMVVSRLVMAAVFPAPYILKELCTGFAIAGMALVLLRLIFNNKLKAVPPLKTFGVSVALIFAAAVFTMIDDQIVWEFTNYSYPEYILSWPVQSVTESFDCDYSADVVYLGGSFSFVQNDFRTDENVEIAYNEKLTDSYRVEIRYKGKESEMYIFHDEYVWENEGIYQDNISIWPVDYDYELSADDIVYMYKHGHDLRYSEPLAIEKIIIRTANPEKIDISKIGS